MAPLGDRQVGMTTNEANVSYKRWALERHDPDDGSGFMAILYNRRLAEAGEILRVDDRMVVDHFETTGFGWTTSIPLSQRSDDRRLSTSIGHGQRGMAAHGDCTPPTGLADCARRAHRPGRRRMRRQLIASARLPCGSNTLKGQAIWSAT